MKRDKSPESIAENFINEFFKLDENIRKIILRRIDRRSSEFNEKLKSLKEFIKINDRLPSGHNSRTENGLVSFIQSYKDDPKVAELVNSVRKYRNYEDNLKDLKEFVKINKRLPQSIKGREESRLRSFITNHKYNEDVIKIINKYAWKTRRFEK